ncbi:MAG: hypothetical protein JWR00_4765 [Rubritepida sp.]|nr:hypothetical protein [Rubritepida sp.]
MDMSWRGLRAWAARGGIGPQALLLATLCALTGLCSAGLGTDSNWDLRNYHLYTAFAFLHGRLGFDLVPAQFQTFFNPLPNLPYYALVQVFNDHPRRVAFLMGLPAGIYAFALGQIAWIMARRTLGPGWPAALATVVVTLMGMTGVAVAPAIGSTINDVTIGAFVMVALWLTLRAADLPVPQPRRLMVHMLLAGLICGAALGLKLTNILYAAPLGLLILALLGLRAAVVAGLAMGLGFLLFWGPFALMLWREYGSPVFPMYNDIFRSPDYLPIRLSDERFLPRDWTQALFYPFYWLRPTAGLVTELTMRDARIAVGYLSALVIGVGLVLRGPWRETLRAERPVILLLLLCLGAYALWAKVFGIYRYLLVVESLAGVLLLLALARLMPRAPWRVAGLTGLAALAVLLTTKLPNWGHVRHGAQVIRLDPLPMPAGGMLLIAGDDGLSYVVPFLPPGVRAVALYDNLIRPGQEHGLTRRIREAVANHGGPFRILLGGDLTPERAAALLTPYGLTLGPCTRLRSNLEPGGHAFCEVERGG